MDNVISPADSMHSRGKKRLSNGLLVLGWLAVGFTTIGFITSWSRDPETLSRGPAAQIGLLLAFGFGIIRLSVRERLVPGEKRARFLYRLQGRIVLTTTLLLSSTSLDIGGKIIGWYLIIFGILTAANPATAWQDYGATSRRKSGWLVRCLTVLAAFFWVMSAFHRPR